MNPLQQAKARMLVLIVEDNATDAKLARLVLQEQGYRVVTASTAEVATEVLKTEHPDVILADLKLGAIDGVTFRRGLKKDARTADIPVIAVTAHTGDFPRALILSENFAGYFEKPIDTRTLSAQVAAAVQAAG